MTQHTCYRKCQRCGEIFDQEKLRYCTVCGLVLCPTCQVAHECKEPEPGELTATQRLTLPPAYFACSSCGGLFLPHHLYESSKTGELLCQTCYRTKINSMIQTTDKQS